MSSGVQVAAVEQRRRVGGAGAEDVGFGGAGAGIGCRDCKPGYFRAKLLREFVGAR